MSNVTISNLTIRNPITPWFNIGHANFGGTLSNIVYKNIAIVEWPERPVLYSNAPGTYTATGITMNGRPVVVK